MRVSQRWASRATLLLALATGCAAEVGADDDPTLAPGVAAAAVQAAEHPHFEVQQTNDLLLRSTGAVFAPMRRSGAPVLNERGEPLRYTCGVTFVSPRYAITAAHCLSDVTTSENVRVEQYDVSTLSGSRLAQAQQVSGSFPDYTHSLLTEADGYRVTRYEQCRLVSRCDYGNVACDTIADVALVRCADRPAGSPHIRVAHRDDERSPVDMQWFHEVLDMPTYDPGMPPVGCFTPSCLAQWQRYDRWHHYGSLPYWGDSAENYHYHPGNQLLPLRSEPWLWGDIWRARTRVGGVGGANLVRDGDFEAHTARTLPATWWHEGPGWSGTDVGYGNEHEGRNNGWIYMTTSGSTQVVQRVSVVPNARYRMSAWVRNSGNGIWADLGARDVATKLDLHYRWTWDVVGSYQRIEFELDVGARSEIEVYAQVIGTAGQIRWLQFDEVRLHRVDYGYVGGYPHRDPTLVWTDHYGCHGTSGSGVVQWNAGVPELLGPIALGTPGPEFADRLCIEGDAAWPGTPLLGYTRTEYSRMMESIARSDPGEI